ncbi:hypothetical protein NA57DRAFT_59616 [Rhizodiscina lignyota]|uniref:Uncharacterized protein n=1 Tax=Rhizodiscina lignyota TaxID=1504668 RepID=A0A9P4I8W5_9PEZI|nr:hypothetical protein NA57DRAFT_59616 [Rhizodiscina lignyota]
MPTGGGVDFQGDMQGNDMGEEMIVDAPEEEQMAVPDVEKDEIGMQDNKMAKDMSLQTPVEEQTLMHPDVNTNLDWTQDFTMHGEMTANTATEGQLAVLTGNLNINTEGKLEGNPNRVLLNPNNK